MTVASLDKAEPDLHVRFGAVDVADATRALTTSTSIYDLPVAEFVLDLDAAAGESVDYLAEVQVSVVWREQEDLIFTGRVLSATPTADGVATQCRGGVALEEQLVPPYATWNLGAHDVIHLLARQPGIPKSVCGSTELATSRPRRSKSQPRWRASPWRPERASAT